MAGLGKFLRRSCSKLGTGWWRVVAEYTNASLPIADVYIRDESKGTGRPPPLHGPFLYLHENGIDPRTGKRWKSAKAVLEFLGVSSYYGTGMSRRLRNV